MPSTGSSILAAVVGAALLCASPLAVDGRSLQGSAPPMPDLTEPAFMTEQMQRAAFSNFVFKFDTPNVQTAHGNLRADLLNTNPVLATLPGNGVGQAKVTLEACGTIQPHLHPRGTEVAFVTKGEVFAGFLEEDGGRLIEATVYEGQNIVFPQALIHFIQNPTCHEVQFVASFPTSDPGTVTIAPNFFRLSESTLASALGSDDAAIDAVTKGALASMNPSLDPVCAAKCGLSGR